MDSEIYHIEENNQSRKVCKFNIVAEGRSKTSTRNNQRVEHNELEGDKKKKRKKILVDSKGR